MAEEYWVVWYVERENPVQEWKREPGANAEEFNSDDAPLA